MIGLLAFDFILRLVRAGVMRVSLIVHVARMDFDDPAADVPGLGIPGHMVANLKRFAMSVPNAQSPHSVRSRRCVFGTCRRVPSGLCGAAENILRRAFANRATVVTDKPTCCTS